MSIPALYILKTADNGGPILDFRGLQAIRTRTFYNDLLYAFDLVPFSFEEGLGALQASGLKGRERARATLNNLISDGFVIISE